MVDKKKKSIFKFYLGFLTEYPITFLLLVIAHIFTFVVSLVLIPYIAKLFVDRASESKDLLFYLILLILAMSSHSIAYTFKVFIDVFFSAKVTRNIRKYLVRYVEGYSYLFFSGRTSGEISQRTSTLIGSYGYIVFWFIEILFPFSVAMVFALFFMFYINLWFGIIFSLWFLLVFAFSILTRNYPIKRFSAYEDSRVKFTASFLDSLANFVNIKSFNLQKSEVKYLDSKIDDIYQSEKTAELSAANIVFALNLLDLLFLVVFGFSLSIFYKKGYISYGDFVLLFSIYNNFKYSFQWIGQSIPMIFQTIGTISNSLNYLLSGEVERSGDDTLSVKDGNIEFKDINLKYENNQLFSGFNLSIKSNEKVGLVGLSGAGKTSLIRLLLGFVSFEGEILIDGQSIKDKSLSSLRDNIGYIPQRPTLFNRSFKDNIDFSNSSKEELVKAIKLAKLDSLLSSFEKGEDTLLGEGGANLSGGERQRVAIARAILKGSKILVMDEATSALDAETEQFIQGSIHNIIKDKTAIVIAHRLTTLKEMDRIVVLDKGKIAEEGKHEELLKKRGLYYKLWTIQEGDFIK